MALGLTQDKLAKALGITFQQIQKYEKGANRIGASRLQAISRILGKPVSFFFSDASAPLSAKLLEVQNVPPAQTVATPAETLDMIKNFIAVQDLETRRHLIGLAQALAGRSADHNDKAAV
jgi:transcriptional regulator with XRE-family HTH domain